MTGPECKGQQTEIKREDEQIASLLNTLWLGTVCVQTLCLFVLTDLRAFIRINIVFLCTNVCVQMSPVCVYLSVDMSPVCVNLCVDMSPVCVNDQLLDKSLVQPAMMKPVSTVLLYVSPPSSRDTSTPLTNTEGNNQAWP